MRVPKTSLFVHIPENLGIEHRVEDFVQAIDETRILICDDERWEQKWSVQFSEIPGFMHFDSKEDLMACRYVDMIDMVTCSLIHEKTEQCHFVAVIQRSVVHTTPMVRAEQKLYMDMYPYLWKRIRCNIYKIIQIMCKRLRTSYVVVDEYGLVPRTIYTANMRLISLHPERVNPEDKIPGIFWMQFIGERMIKETCTAEEAVHLLRSKGVLCNHLSSAFTKGVFVQTSSLLESDNKDRHQVVYELLRSSMYRPDPHQIAIIRQRHDDGFFVKLPV